MSLFYFHWSILIFEFLMAAVINMYDDVTKWKHFPRYWPFVRGIHRSPVNSPHKGQWRGALMFSLICVWINGCVNNHEAGDWRRYRAHYDVSVMYIWQLKRQSNQHLSRFAWWRHHIGTLSSYTLPALCEGHAPLTGDVPDSPQNGVVKQSFVVVLFLNNQSV